MGVVTPLLAEKHRLSMAIRLSSSEYSSQCRKWKERRHGRTGGSRRGEATQGSALMDDNGDVYDKTRILSQ